MYLTTRNPNVKSLRDFTDKDRIAVPSVKVSVQAVTPQMAAEKEFGPGNYSKLDSLTVSLGAPEAQAALLSGKSEITAHLSSPPFQYQQLKHPGIHKVLDSYDVLGGAGIVQRRGHFPAVPRRKSKGVWGLPRRAQGRHGVD